jgi:hypothetical protein
MKKNTQNNPIKANNLSNQIYNIRVSFDHIFISNKNNSLEISEIVVFRNEGEEISITARITIHSLLYQLRWKSENPGYGMLSRAGRRGRIYGSDEVYKAQ